MRMEDMVIASVDDHIVEPPDMFDNQLTAQQRANAPQVKEVNGNQVWVWDDLVKSNIGLNAVVGRPKNEWGMEPARFDHMRKAAYDVDARVDDMNANGTFSSLGFPTFPGFHGAFFLERARKDPNNAYAVLQAYNNWHIDEWCGKHPTRFIPLAIGAHVGRGRHGAGNRARARQGMPGRQLCLQPRRDGPARHSPAGVGAAVGNLRPRGRHAQLPYRLRHAGAASLPGVAHRGVDHRHADVPSPTRRPIGSPWRLSCATRT